MMGHTSPGAIYSFVTAFAKVGVKFVQKKFHELTIDHAHVVGIAPVGLPPYPANGFQAVTHILVEGVGGLHSRHSLIVRPVDLRSCKCSNRQIFARVGSPRGRDLKQVINYSYQ